MSFVVLSGKNEMPSLETLNRWGKVEIGVRPLMDLIRQCNVEGEQHPEPMPCGEGFEFGRAVGEQLPEEVSHLRYANGEVIPVAFDEIVSGDGRRINVMLTEGTDHMPANERIHRAPCISTPMDDAR